MIDVTPPVPTCLRIERRERTGRGLWIENNEMIGIRPGIIPGVINKLSIDIAGVLLASVKCDVDAASLAVGAIFGDEDKAGVAET
jgi:hypothetical protein